MNGLSAAGPLTLAGSQQLLDNSNNTITTTTRQLNNEIVGNIVIATNTNRTIISNNKNNQNTIFEFNNQLINNHHNNFSYSNSENNMQAYDAMLDSSSMQLNHNRFLHNSSSYGAIHLEPDEGSSEDIWDLDSNTVRRYTTIGDDNNGGEGGIYNNMGIGGYPHLHHHLNNQPRANSTTLDQINQSKSHHWSNHSMQYVNQQQQPGFPLQHHVTPHPQDDKWTYKSNNEVSRNGSNNNNTPGGGGAAPPTANTTGANSGNNDLKKPKTYQCDACDKWFTSSGHLKRHFNTTLHKNAMKHRTTGLNTNNSMATGGSAANNVSQHAAINNVNNYSSNSNSSSSSQQPTSMDPCYMRNNEQHSISSKYNSSTSPSNERITNQNNSLVSQNITSQNVPSSAPATNLGYYEHQQQSVGLVGPVASNNPQQASGNNTGPNKNATSPITTTTVTSNFNAHQQQHIHNVVTKSPHPYIQQQQQQQNSGAVDQHHINSTAMYENRPPSNSIITFTQPIPQQLGGHDMYPEGSQNQPPQSQVPTQQPNQQQQQQQQQQQNTLYQNNVSIHSSSGYNSTSLSPSSATDPYSIHYSGFPFNGINSYSPSTEGDANTMYHHPENQGNGNNTASSLFTSSDNASSPYSLSDEQAYIGDTNKYSPSSDQGVKSPREKTDVGEFRCNDCNKTFNRICYLKQHNKSFHNGEKPYKCGQCGKRFPVEILYQEHLAKHAGDKPYKCEVCPKQFNHKTDLRRHMCLHTGEKPFTCDVCGKGFIREDRMIKHSDTHKKKQNTNMLMP